MQTAVYYFPNYHVDPRNELIHGKDWTEWELMKQAKARFPGHDQPKIPLWGYEDEANPAVMAKKIAAGANHGINAFIFDWYWYEGPFLERALTDGFLAADNNSRLKFALMWANHDWKNFHPGSRNVKSYPIDLPWTTTRDTVGFVWDYIVERFLSHPQYWCVGGKPYFSIYAFNRFITQMGGIGATAEVIASLDEKVRKAGLPGVHVNAIWFDLLDSSPYYSACPQADWCKRIGISSYTSYNNICINKQWSAEFPRVDYDKNADHYLEVARKAMRTLPAPYYPVLTMGWDSSPRTVQSEVYDSRPGYPFLPVMEPSPEKFDRALQATREILSSRPEPDQVMFINAWNEWTEGSYLEPDEKHGLAFLEVIKRHVEDDIGS